MTTETLNLVNYWLKDIIIGLDLCPFARIPFQRKTIRVVECLDVDDQDQFDFLTDELELLLQKESSELSTTLVSFPNCRLGFEDFFDFSQDIQDMLEDAELLEHFQIVCFHPDFYFEDTLFDDVGNYVNRSPFPLIHIIRAKDFKGALAKPEDGEIISYNNGQKLNSMEPDELERLFYYLKK